ncbi:MAG: class I SAM-dependent methyltransferase [Candidatus Omnitrophica bacterium]|nr:class I SAM-dependent methyltransferase [Candidatus Omnitrophota bacterium]
MLDIGTGLLAMVAAKDFNCNVTSIDISEEALGKAKKEALKENIKKINFEEEDATALSYKDNSFDVVVSYCALHHIPLEKRKNFIHEAYRVARQRIVIADYNEAGFPHSAGEYTIVDFNWLKKELNALNPKTEEHEWEKIKIYTCLKGGQE